MITFDNGRFHLQFGDSSYVIGLEEGIWPVQLYWGRRLKTYSGSNPVPRMDRIFSPNPTQEDRTVSLDTIPHEYPVSGTGDFRPPAVRVRFANGSTVCHLQYVGYDIIKGRPDLSGLPHVRDEKKEAETLVLHLTDKLTSLSVYLNYTVFEDSNVLCRSAKIINNSTESVTILDAASACVDLRDNRYELITLWGAWANERNVERRALSHGLNQVSSARGTSSHQFSPFIAVAEPNTTEDFGNVYAFCLVYSGNFSASAFVDQYEYTRLRIGMNAETFQWNLQGGESFQTPEAMCLYSNAGLQQISSDFHDVCYRRITHPKYHDMNRPILINNWEATYFDFDSDRILNIARKGKDFGMELFVLDDGWFGHRNDDCSSLGDWFVNEAKLPGGLGALSKRIADIGMRFGIWMEPEMVSVDSELYRAHPDWCFHVPDRPHCFGRGQLVLNLSRDDVCEYIIDAVSSILSNSDITYMKWDMNRHMTNVFSPVLPPDRQGEVAHRYMLGLYRVFDTIVNRFPKVLFESCSGGGGRFDAGLLFYMPQAWVSDNTDAISRLKIQYGTSLVFPAISMGAHVSVVPNHQTGRVTPLQTRAAVAMAGCFGYELDITQLTEDEEALVKDQIKLFKSIRDTVQFGRLYRILSPFEDGFAAWNFVSKDGAEVVATCVNMLSAPNAPVRIVKLKGLNPDAQYRDAETEKTYGGDELMYAGLTVFPNLNDFESRMWIFHRL